MSIMLRLHGNRNDSNSMDLHDITMNDLFDRNVNST